MDINKLLSPQKTAIIGASEKEGFGGDTCRNAISYADMSNVYMVNPKRSEVFGYKCWPSLSSIPENIDLAILCTPQKSIVPLIKEAAAVGVRAVVVYASGYSETGTQKGEQAEIELKELCNQLDIALMGPNCAGFMNYNDHVSAFAFISEQRDRSGSVGFISQSGQLCLSFIDHPAMRFSYCISAGNCAVVTMEDYLQFLINDQKTKVIGIYLEGVTNPQKFVSALANAAKKRKPIIIHKVGKSKKGERVAASHTGSLSGSDDIYSALFEKFGVIRVDDAEELLATTQLLATITKLPEKAGFASLSFSGGETGICADLGEKFSIEYPDFSQKTLSRLRELLPSYATPANPLDTTATIAYDIDTYANVLEAVIEDPSVDMVIIGYTLLYKIADPAIHYMAEGIKKIVENGCNKPIAMLPFFENTRNPEYEVKLAQMGIPVLPPPAYGFAALRNLSNYVKYSPEKHTLEIAIPKKSTKKTGKKILSELESQEILHKFNIPTPKTILATDEEEAVQAAEKIQSPVVMKICSAQIAHKSDIGGVKLNIKGEHNIRGNYRLIVENARKKLPNADIDGVLIQEMLPPGKEIIVGVKNDPQFGPAILVGLGGIFVEVFKDTALLPAPFNKEEALVMLKSLKAWPLFSGYRGQAELDVEKLTEILASVSKMAADFRDTIAEFDINPLFVFEKGKGVCAADALAVFIYE
ncbi:MAG: acetyl-CoA synthetase [Deltaproteobacteria bacterium]|nr:MAG: acetyl-CoA synthetase [Deltaproteobacteria bacterium]